MTESGLRKRKASWVRWIARVVFYNCGGYWLWRLLNRNRIAILKLHGVIDEQYEGQWRPMRLPHSVRNLRAGLMLLKKHYQFVSLDTAVQMLEGKRSLIRNAMVVTFDDGYRNQFKYALPVLRELGIPATYYIATNLVGRRETYWFDRLDYALQAANVDGRELTVGGKQVTLHSANRGELAASYAEIRKLAKGACRSDCEMLDELGALAEELEAEAGRRLADIFEDDDWSAVATWPELREHSSDALVDIQSHTLSHARLAQVDDDQAAVELRSSREEIECQLTAPCMHVCYPSGSYDERIMRIVAESGYRTAVTSDGGLNGAGQCLLSLQRVSMPDTDDPVTVAFVSSGFKDFLVNLKARARSLVGVSA